MVKRHGIRCETFRTRGTSPLADVAELIALGGALTYYLGLQNRVNPGPVPWVDEFKRRLGK